MVGRRRLDGWVITAACAVVGNSKDIANRETLNGRISITQSSAKNGQPITDSVRIYDLLDLYTWGGNQAVTVLLGIHPPMRYQAMRRRLYV